MKKTLLLLILSSFSFILYSQYYFGVQAGATHPITTYETIREFGAELGVNFGKKVYKQFYFETGLITDAYGKRNNPIINNLKWNPNNATPTSYTEDGAFIRFSAQIPLLLSTTFKDDIFQIKTGVLLSGRNILTFTKYTGFDPEISSNSLMYNTSEKFLGSRKYGIDFHLGFALKIYKELRLYLNYRTPINSLFIEDGIYSMGLKYNLISR